MHVLTIAIQGQYIIILIYVFSISMPKVALLTFYHRVFMTKTFRRVVLATIGIIVAGMLSLLVSFALLCKPLEHIWKPQVKGKCLNFHQMVVTCNYMNLIVNIWVFILPIPLIQQLKVSNSRKLALCSIFLVGLLYV